MFLLFVPDDPKILLQKLDYSTWAELKHGWIWNLFKFRSISSKLSSMYSNCYKRRRRIITEKEEKLSTSQFFHSKRVQVKLNIDSNLISLNWIHPTLFPTVDWTKIKGLKLKRLFSFKYINHKITHIKLAKNLKIETEFQKILIITHYVESICLRLSNCLGLIIQLHSSYIFSNYISFIRMLIISLYLSTSFICLKYWLHLHQNPSVEKLVNNLTILEDHIFVKLIFHIVFLLT